MSDFWYLDKGRIISLVIAGIYLILSFFAGYESFLWLKMLIFLLLPLGCIWFSDAMGGFEGTCKGRYMSSTPGIFVKFIGWVLLFLPVIIVVISFIE